MRKFICILILILQTSLLYSDQGWNELPVITNNSLYSIYFINPNTGFVCGNSGSLYKTTNGGSVWLPNSSPGIHDYRNIYFLDSLKGILTTDPIPSEAGYWFIVYFTSNQGASWTQIAQLYNYISDSYSDSSEFFLSFKGSFGFETTGGIAFSQINNISFNSLPTYQAFRNSSAFSVCKINNKVWISASYGDDVGTDVNRVGYSTNYGANWNIILYDSAVTWTEPPAHNKFYKLRFLNDSIGYMSSKMGLMKTNNGGSNWYFLDTTFTKNIQQNFFTSQDTGWVFAGNKIYKTISGGINWDQQFTYSANFTQPFFLNSLTGYVLCDNRRILKTTTGGLVSVLSNTDLTGPEKYFLQQNFPNPFNPSTNLEFEIPELGFVSLKVYDALGKVVRTLVNENRPAGYYNVEFDGSDLPSGVYFYRLEAGKFAETKRMILLK